MNYGMPYMGSKNSIAKWVISHIPSCDDIYDLFGGGGAISHCLSLSRRFKTIHYNELNSITYNGFKMAVNGEFKDENRWINREDFFKLKNTDPYVAICFSFGGALRTYSYAEDIEPIKKAMHYAICFDDYSDLDKFLDGYKIRLYENTLANRRIELQKNLTKIYNREYKSDKYKNIFNSCNSSIGCVRSICQNLERLERIQNLERLERIQNLEIESNIQFSNLNYLDVQIKPNSVIYCDPPYFMGNDIDKQYKFGENYIEFDHLKFFDWCRNQENLVIISNYQMPSDFICIDEIKKAVSFNDKGSKTAKESNLEKLYIPKHQKDLYLEKFYEDDW